MQHTTTSRVRLRQQDRCLKLILGGKDVPTTPDATARAVSPAARLRPAPTYTPAEIAAATAPAKHKPLISTEALFGVGYALGLATGALIMAFLIRAGVLL